jgi:hypothetical protein
MSEALSINGKNLLPIKEVVGRTKYTRDYIAKLAREGQIVGAQVGRQWFIDETSLARFTETTQLEAEVRKRHLSRERRLERDVKVEIKNRFDVVAAQPRYRARLGAVRALAVVVCAVLSGYVFYVAPPVLSTTAALQTAQSLLSGTTHVIPTEPEHYELPVASLSLQRVVFSDTHEVRRFGAETEGVLVLPSGTTSTGVAVAELFSDPVAVAYSAPGVGTVSLKGANDTATTGIPFVTVPIASTPTDLEPTRRILVPEATP